MTDVGRALEQIAEIHDRLAASEVYRGWRPVPVALSGLVGIAAALWQSAHGAAADAEAFTVYWLTVGAVGLVVGCSEIAWHYGAHATPTDRRRSRAAIGQLVPALAAGAVITGALVRLNPPAVALLPGIWAVLFGVAIFAAGPYIPRASVWIALYFSAAGVTLLVTSPATGVPSPWSVGGTFGGGQLLAALVARIDESRRQSAAQWSDEEQS